MNKLKLKVDGIGYEFIVMDGVMRSTKCVSGEITESFHLRKQKKNRISADFRTFQPESLHIVDGAKLEFWCSEVKNNKSTTYTYDLGDTGAEGWWVSVIVEFVSYDGTDYMGRDYTLFNEEK